MKAVYNIMNNQNKVTMEHNYHIRCDTGLEEVLCAMQLISSACTEYGEQLSNPWLPNLYKPYNQIMISNPKHVSTLSSYVAIINGTFPKLTFKIETTNPDKMEIKDELVLNVITRSVTRLDIIFFDGQVTRIPYSNNIHFMHSILQL